MLGLCAGLLQTGQGVWLSFWCVAMSLCFAAALQFAMKAAELPRYELTLCAAGLLATAVAIHAQLVLRSSDFHRN